MIGLLAIVFTVKPIVDSNAQLGFLLGSWNITVQTCYLFTLGFMCLAVYFSSCQFLTEKKFKFLEKLTNVIYGVSLSLPPLFVLTWGLAELQEFIIATWDLEELRKYATTGLSLLSATLSVISVFITTKSFERKAESARKLDESKENIEHLKQAQILLSLNMYDLVIIETAKVVESSIKSLLLKYGIYVQPLSFLQLLKEARTNQLLESDDIDLLNELRVKRNKSAHEQNKASKQDAERVLEIASGLYVKLNM
ncbi:MAG: HEPN domain-containing protein [Flavobacteriaceae bacterium]|nr:HEPN domain-containing protein [Flavobacteriaceae bacterium]